MPKSFAIVAFALAASLSAVRADAATSLPMPEAGFSLASNSGGGVDTIAAPMSSDLGGGAIHEPSRRGAEVAVETPGNEASTSETAANPSVREDHAHKSGAAEGTSGGNSGSASHKSRGNARWQSLLPGLMK